MNSVTNSTDTSVGGIFLNGLELLPLEAQPPTPAEWASWGVALLFAGLAMLWVALCEWLKERWG